MGSLYRNYFVAVVVGMFCLFNASIVSAQTATNLDCFWCVGPGEVGYNAVPWASLDPSVRQALQAQQDKLDALQARVDATEGTVLDLSELPVIITEPGVYVLDRNWSVDGLDVNAKIIDVQATATIDLRGFEISVDDFQITVISMSNGGTVKNGRIDNRGENSSGVVSAGATLVQNLLVDGFVDGDGLFLGSGSTVLNSIVGVGGVGLGDDSSIRSSSLACLRVCLIVNGNGVTVTGNTILGAEARVRVVEVRGDNNVFSQNTIKLTERLGFALRITGNDNLIFDNSIVPLDSDGGISAAAIEINGSGNVIKDNILRPGEFVSPSGIRFLQDGNFYGDNLMSADVPFDLGGTVQTDLGGNVGF